MRTGGRSFCFFFLVNLIGSNIEALLSNGIQRRRNCRRMSTLMVSDDPFKRIGRIAKDKLGQAPEVNPVLGGAVIGGIIAGPFGMLLGIGAGNSFANQKTAETEMQRMGMSKELIAEAQKLAQTLQDAQAASKASVDARETLKQRSLSLDQTYEQLQDRARECLKDGDEDGARAALQDRQKVGKQRDDAVLEFRAARERVERIDRDVSVLKQKVEDFDALILRSARAQQQQQVQGNSFEYEVPPSVAAEMPLTQQDPLLDRFAKLEREMEEKRKEGEEGGMES